MFCKFNNTKLPFAEICSNFVKIFHINLSSCFSNIVNPILLAFSIIKIQNPWFIWWKNNLYWVQHETRIRVYLYCTFLNKSSCKAMHHSWIRISLFSVTKQIFSDNKSPMFFEAISSCLEETFAFHFKLRLIDLSESV